jgi:DNA-binding CsgD family transcriptional regulator
VCAVARRARRAPDCERPAAGTVRLASGRWLTVQGARLEAARGAARIAVILAAAEPAEVLPLELELHGLTEREREVTRLLARGWSTKQIARGLSITHHTVKDHTKAIYAKLEVTSRAELTAKLFYEHHAPSLGPGAVREFAPAEWTPEGHRTGEGGSPSPAHVAGTTTSIRHGHFGGQEASIRACMETPSSALSEGRSSV